jgi:predicted dehydrogenase
MSKDGRSRRAVLQQAAGLAGLAAFTTTVRAETHVLGANERLGIGVIGAGDRGTALMAWVESLARTHNAALVAVCDIWNRRRGSAADVIREWTNRDPIQCRRMEELCQRPEVDAILIATPDFQHPPLTRQAVEAGKDVYVEKPFGCDFDQIRLARDAVLKSGRIVQVGTQRRSHGVPWAARDFLHSGGLGTVSYVEMVDSLFQPRWRIPGSEKSLTEHDTDWPEFLSYTPEIPFDARKYREFRLFWPFSTGIFCQWMSHAVDLVNLVLDEHPKAVTAAGGVYVWPDGRANPDTAQCLVEYPSGCMFSYHMRLGNSAAGRSLMFYGTRGTLDLYAGVAYGEGGGGEIFEENPGASVPILTADASKRLPARDKGGVILEAEPDGDHMADFLTAVRTRRQPRADVQAGFAHALATSMAGMSLREGMRMVYNPFTDTVTGARPRIASQAGT